MLPKKQIDPFGFILFVLAASGILTSWVILYDYETQN